MAKKNIEANDITQGDLPQIFPTFPNPILNLDFHLKMDPPWIFGQFLMAETTFLSTKQILGKLSREIARYEN